MYSLNPPRSLVREVKSLKNKRCIITFHSLADVDSCASAIVLSQYLGNKSIVALQDSANSQAKRLFEISKMHKFDQATTQYPNAKIIVLDCNEKILLPKISKYENKIHILIDHHAKSANSINAKYEWINPQSSSVAQMISQLIKQPTTQQAKILLLAMICDSAGFSNSDSNTFLQASKLLKIYAKDYGELERMLHSHASIQTRLRVLEGLRNISFVHNGGFICATAQAASNESQIADIFLKAGADCAFVASASKSKCTICARMRRRHTCYVDLSLIMQEVGKVLGGSGGGHPCASGASGNLPQNITDALILSQSLFFAQRLARIKI